MVPLDVPVGQAAAGGYVIVLTDVTEEKLSLEEIIENERTGSIVRLAAGVAHELGNPLNSLTIHLQLMERRLAKLEDSGQGSQLAESIGSAEQRCSDWTESLVISWKRCGRRSRS